MEWTTMLGVGKSQLPRMESERSIFQAKRLDFAQ
jgi:hypothetical protein